MATAIYINQTQIIAVTVGGSARKPKLKSVASGFIAEARTEDGAVVVDRTKHLATEITRFLKENKVGGGHQILLVGPDAMRYRELKLAFSDRRQIDKVIQFQVEGVIPSVPIEDLAVSYTVLSADEGGSRVLVMAADRDYIRKRLDALDMAGITVDSVDCNLSGTLNLGLLHEQLSGEKPPTLWLDFAGTTATASLVLKGKVHTTRVFVSPYVSGVQGAAPTAEQSKLALKQLESEAANRALEPMKEEYVLLSPEQAAGSEPEPPTLPAADTATSGLPKAESVNLGAQEVADRIRKMSREELFKFVNRVAVEARRLLYMTRIEGGAQRLVVSGLGHEGQQLAAALANELHLEESHAIDLMESVTPRDRDGNTSVKVPDLGEITFLTGVALKGLGRDETKVDYRTGDLAAGTLFDYAKTPLAFTATMVFLFAGVMFLIAFTQVQTLQRETARLVAEPYDMQLSFNKATRKAKMDTLQISATKRQELKTYPVVEEEPATEIQLVYNRLNEHFNVVSGLVVTEHPIPHRADVIVSEVIRALQNGKPSYDFAVIRIDVTQETVTVNYFASTSETAEEVKARGGEREDVRMSNALKKLMKDKSDLFDGEPVPAGGTARGVKNGDRTANEIRLTLKLQKVKEPVKAPVGTQPKK